MVRRVSPRRSFAVRSGRRRRDRHRSVGEAVLPLRRHCLPVTTCAYTIHEAAATMGSGIRARSRRSARCSTGLSPPASSRSARSGAGRRTTCTSSSSPAPTVGCGSGAGPRPVTSSAVPAAGGQGARAFAEVAARPARTDDGDGSPGPGRTAGSKPLIRRGRRRPIPCAGPVGVPALPPAVTATVPGGHPCAVGVSAPLRPALLCCQRCVVVRR